MPDERDQLASLPVRSCVRSFTATWNIVTEDVDLGEGGVVTRDLVDHPGAVGILALDEQDRVVLVQQYRHPVGAYEWSSWRVCSTSTERHRTSPRREPGGGGRLPEAAQWHLLLDHYTSSGGSSESVRVFLARGLTDVPVESRHARDGEELGMPVRRVLPDELVESVLAGDVHNGTLMVSPWQPSGCASGAGSARARSTSCGRRGPDAADERASLRGPVGGGADAARRTRRCPCGGVPAGAALSACCGPVVAGELAVSTAEALMRSRYTAYVLGDGDHLFAPGTPAPAATMPTRTRGLLEGLSVLDVVAGGPQDTDGIVVSRPLGQCRRRAGAARAAARAQRLSAAPAGGPTSKPSTRLDETCSPAPRAAILGHPTSLRPHGRVTNHRRPRAGHSRRHREPGECHRAGPPQRLAFLRPRFTAGSEGRGGQLLQAGLQPSGPVTDKRPRNGAFFLRDS